MKLVVGLGNPGERYAGTRHNVGFEVVDEVADRQGLIFRPAPAQSLIARWRRPEDVVLVAKPQTLMNLSGRAVVALSQYYKVPLEDVLIVCDDVNLALGRLRARASGSEGGHNGLRSIAEELGTVDYARLRVGVGRGDSRRDLADHVLAKFEPDEAPAIRDAVVRAANAVNVWITDGLPRMMNTFNRAEDAP